MRISFIWQGYDTHKNRWRDGLYAALQLIEQEHEVRYFDTTHVDDVRDYNPDVVLYWESPITLRGKDAENYKAVLNLPSKKALLFAGGPVNIQTSYGFDLYFVESKINEEEFEALGLPWKRAFGVNTQIFKPENLAKVYDGMMHATFAGWKRHELFADALGDKGLAVGRIQESDRAGYNRCIERKVNVMDECPAEYVARLINRAHCVVNTAEYWGGGQRCTLEAMACGVPVVVMSDSPKNCEYVEESEGGMVVNPTVEDIRAAVEYLKEYGQVRGLRGREYIQSKWTERHYADALLEGIKQIL